MKQVADRRGIALLAALLAIELGLAGVLLALHRKAGAAWSDFLAHTPGFAFLAGVTLIGAGALGALLIVARQRPRRALWPWLVLNLSAVAATLLVAELGLRLLWPSLYELFPRGPMPMSWAEVVERNRGLLRDADAEHGWRNSYLVRDATTGWRIGANRSSKNGLYFSSAEGIRSADPDAHFVYDPDKHYIALLGDSYTFGLSVPFEQSWGNRLQQRVAPQFEVLNFGVGGFGLDQMLLRYRQKVTDWHPQLVIVGLISHDLYRTMTVYTFLAFPHWELPFSKPRYVLRDGELELLNVPLEPLGQLLSTKRIQDLPFIDLEPSYLPGDWTASWLEHAYLARLAISMFPNWVPDPDEETMVALNAALVGKLLQEIRAHGGYPLLVFFPSWGSGEVRNGMIASTARMLQRTGEPYLDIWPCVRDLSAKQLIAADGMHYSGLANARVAACIYDYAQPHLQRLAAVPPPGAGS